MNQVLESDVLQTDWLQQLDDFADRFRDDFRRRDQARWASVYLQGLLSPTLPRKTISTLARHVVLPADLLVEDSAQALQNFINQSPWDETRVAQRARAILLEALADPEAALVVDEVAIVKQGRHSVGVQRQYSSSLGRKANCQVAVVVYHLGRAGICPLALRLYLPRHWLSDADRVTAAGVPRDCSQPMTKPGIALQMLDMLRAEGWLATQIAVGDSYTNDSRFVEEAKERGYELMADDQNVAPRQQSRRAGQLLLNEFGLDHFEGRGWRGFHHHATLVLLAYSFRMLRQSR